jgi:WD40 repeat protein/TolB-like protein
VSVTAYARTGCQVLVTTLCVSAPAEGQAVAVTPEGTLEVSGNVTALAFSADGQRLFTGTDDGTLTIHDLGTRQRLLSAHAGDGEILFAAFLGGDTAVVSVNAAGGVLIHRAGGPSGPRPGADTPTVRLGTEHRPTRIALDAGLRYLAVATRSSGIELFDLTTRQRVGLIDARGAVDDLLHLGFDRLGRQLIAVTRRGQTTAWNPATLQPLRRLTLQSDELHGSRSVVHAVGADRSANVLMVALEEVALPRGGLRGRARPTDLVRRDRLLIFDWHSGAMIKTVPFQDGVIERLAVGPGNDHAVVAHGSRVTVMDLRRGERGAGISAPGRVSRLAISPDDQRLAVASTGGQVGLWSMAYQEPLAADELPGATPGLSGRLRVLGDDSPAIARDTPVTLAIMPFDDRQGNEQLARMVAELLTTQLANFDHLTLVERLRIDDILREQDLQRRGITEAHGLELGRILNADYVLLGSIGAFGTSQMLSARLLRVETGEVVSGRQVLCEECRAQDFFDVIHLLGTTIAR